MPEVAESRDEHHRVHGRLRLLGALLPPAAFGFLFGGYWIASSASEPVRWVWAINGAVGVAAGLVLVYLVITVIRAGERRSARTLLSCLIGLAMLGIIYAGFIVDQIEIHGLFGGKGPAPLSSAMETAAVDSGFVAAAFLESGRSGALTHPSWTGADGTTVRLDVSWMRNQEGILVTVTPQDPVPDGQDGSAVSKQALPNGMIGVPMGFYEEQKKQAASRFLGDVLLVPVIALGEQLTQKSTTPILTWSKANAGALPGVEEGDRLLASLVGTITPLPLPAELADEKDHRIDVTATIQGVAYRPNEAMGIFAVDLDLEIKSIWTGAGVQGGEPIPGMTGRAVLKKTMTITATAGGMLALPRGDPGAMVWYGGPVADLFGWGVIDALDASAVLPDGGGWVIQESDPTVPGAETAETEAKGTPAKP